MYVLPMVVEAGASFGALHLAVAGEKVATHALGPAMFLVRAEEMVV